MENGVINDGQISASSEWDGNHAAVQGRLYFKAGGGKQGAWSARSNNENQWLQIDLGNTDTKVTRVGSQGREGHNQWVTKYKLQHSTDGTTFQYYKDEGQAADKVKCRRSIHLLHATGYLTCRKCFQHFPRRYLIALRVVSISIKIYVLENAVNLRL